MVWRRMWRFLCRIVELETLIGILKYKENSINSNSENNFPSIIRVYFLFLHVKIIMDKKLTLSLNASVVEKAKLYAKDHGVSLSRMIENYLSALTVKEVNEDEIVISPLVNRLIGVIDLKIDDLNDYETDYTDYLMEKYK